MWAGGVLAGLRVLDLAAGIAGGSAALHLSEAGAEVIKVEPPGGRPGRDLPPWSVLNRGKASVVVDLSMAEGRARLQALLADADVLIHDFTPTEAAARGLADAALNELYPQ